jgi:uncharacterized protein DUF4136
MRNPAPTSNADLCTAAHAATKQERTLNTFYNGFGDGWRWGGGFGSATTTTDTYRVGTLVVDIFDARTKEAIWRGTSSKTLSGNPQKNAENLNKDQGERRLQRVHVPDGVAPVEQAHIKVRDTGRADLSLLDELRHRGP